MGLHEVALTGYLPQSLRVQGAVRDASPLRPALPMRLSFRPLDGDPQPEPWPTAYSR